MNAIVWDNESVCHDIWPKSKCRSVWPICHGPAILPYILKTIWCMNFIIWDYESVWPEVWPQNKFSSLWPIFHGPTILCYILKTVWLWTSFFGIMGQYDPTFDLKINVGLCDIYFMVQWFCFISPRLFDAWVSYSGWADWDIGTILTEWIPILIFADRNIYSLEKNWGDMPEWQLCGRNLDVNYVTTRNVKK